VIRRPKTEYRKNSENRTPNGTLRVTRHYGVLRDHVGPRFEIVKIALTAIHSPPRTKSANEAFGIRSSDFLRASVFGFRYFSGFRFSLLRCEIPVSARPHSPGRGGSTPPSRRYNPNSDVGADGMAQRLDAQGVAPTTPLSNRDTSKEAQSLGRQPAAARPPRATSDFGFTGCKHCSDAPDF
jgi:hypothetical protein